MYHFWSFGFQCFGPRVVALLQPLPFYSATGECEFVFSVIVTIDLGLDENIYGLGLT